MGSVIPESEALDFESAAHGESHTWRATREFALLGEILGAFEWGTLDVLMFDLPPGAERTVQYADYLGAADLVRAGDDPFRGGARRGRALGGRPVEGSQSPPRLRREHERLLLPRLQRHQAAVSTSPPSGLEIPCLGTVPFDPELARHCDEGIPFEELPGTPVGSALDHVAQRLLDSLESTIPAGSIRDEISLRPLRQPDEAADRRSARARLALGRLLVSGVRLRDGDADQCVRDPGRSVTRRADRPRRQARGRGRSGGRVRREVSVLRDDSGAATVPAWRTGLVRWTPPRKPGSRTFPSSSGRWREPASRSSRRREAPSKWTNRSWMRRATSSVCNLARRHGSWDLRSWTTEHVRQALRRLLEPDLPLQSRLRALLSRRRPHASRRHGELRRSQ